MSLRRSNFRHLVLADALGVEPRRRRWPALLLVAALGLLALLLLR